MKFFRLLPVVAWGLATAAPAAEHLWNGFDTCAPGSIAGQPGWSRAPWVNTRTAQVSAARAYSSSNSLELPLHADGSSAAYTNFQAVYFPASNHPVIRCSAMLYNRDTNAVFQIGLRDSASGRFLAFQPLAGQGTLGFVNPAPVAVPFVTNRFANATFHYNRSNNHYRLDYDYTNRLPWTTNTDSAVVVTQFNQFAALRLTNAAGTPGDFFLDDVRVETFPPHVWAWWRCTPLPVPRLIEQLGAFPPAERNNSGDQARAGSSDPVWDGTHDFHNEGATRQPITSPANCEITTPATTNWTVEAVFLMETSAAQNVAFMAWGYSNGFATNGSYIAFGYNHGGRTFYYNARDAQQPDAVHDWGYIGELQPDGRWHHLAFVKTNGNLRLYFDYQWITTHALSAAGDGSYAFDPLSRATVGQSLNFGNSCGPDTRIDEIRVSGKALALSEFLQPGQPMIVDIRNAATENPWQLTMKGILNHTYRIETSPRLGPGADWQPGSGFVVENTFTFLDIPSAARTNFVRVVREN